MAKTALSRLLLLTLISGSLLQSCKDDKEDLVAPPEPVPDQSYVEDFDNLATAEGKGWIFQNKSDYIQPGTEKGWFIADDFTPQSGTGYLFSAYYIGGATASPTAETLSAWAISPPVILQNGDKISFYALTYNDYSDPGDVYPDRLQLRVNPYGDNETIADDPTATGAFTVNLIDVNPGLISTEQGFPSSWTKFEGTITGLSKPIRGRYALRYYVPHNGPNGNAIGVDRLEYKSVTP